MNEIPSMVYPIYLSYSNSDKTREWKFAIQSEPVNEILFNGDVPTFEEMSNLIKTIDFNNNRYILVKTFISIIESGKAHDSQF